MLGKDIFLYSLESMLWNPVQMTLLWEAASSFITLDKQETYVAYVSKR